MFAVTEAANQRPSAKGGYGQAGPSPVQTERDRFMLVADRIASRGAVIALGLLFLAPLTPAWAQIAAPNAPLALVPHRAVYDLSLGEIRGNSQVAGITGRILYDF